MELDYDQLLELSSEVGLRLMESGAEIYRTEESIHRILRTYGIETGEVFVIPNCIIVSLTTPSGHPVTRVRRVPNHGTDIFRLEQYNALCRRLCHQAPPFSSAMAQLKDIQQHAPNYSLLLQLFGYFWAGFFFTLFFKGTLADGICGGLCSVSIGLTQSFMSSLGSNPFFKTVVGGMISALLAIFLTAMGLGQHVDFITIGALMVLVPGITFTSAIRDIMAGDLVSGITKVSEALLVGGAIAIGTSIAVGFSWLIGGVL